MMKHDQGITCTLMTLLLLAALSYLSINAQVSHAIEATTAELAVVQDSSHAPNPTGHDNILISASFENSTHISVSLVSALLSVENGERLFANFWHHAPNTLRNIFSNR
jgi:accessory gene regulator protein AgrB